MSLCQARLASKLAEEEVEERKGEGAPMPPSPYGPIEGSEEGDITASKGPQFFAAFTATMGQFGGKEAVVPKACAIH